MNEREAVYLDHAATSWPKPSAVGECMLRSLADLTANAGRSGHEPSVDSARVVFQTREYLAELLGVRRSENLVFVRGCTEGLNLVIKGFLDPGAVVALSPLEHNSVMRPLMERVQRYGIQLETLPADPWGRVDLEACRPWLRDRKLDLAVVCHASNVNGVVQDLRGLRDVLGDIPLLVDAAQTAGVLPIDVERDGIDFLSCSAHKGLLGPTGVGVCYLKPVHEVRPLQEGGTGSRSESLEHPDFRPDRYEAGTLNLHGIAGTLGALQSRQGEELLGQHKRQLTLQLLEQLQRVPGVHLHSPVDGTALCASLTFAHERPDIVAARLENEFGVLCRPGLQCAPAAHQHLKTYPHGSVRLSPGWGNTTRDIETAIQAVSAALH